MRHLLATALLMLAVAARATVIEGTTPSGKFKTVGLTEQGDFRVSISSGLSTHVITDTGSVSQVSNTPATPLYVVTAPSSVGLTVTASTSTLTVTGQTVVGLVSTNIYPSDPVRKQGCVCNGSDSMNLWVGGAGVTTGSGVLINPGGCLCPDVPSSFTGALYGVSTGTVNTSFFYTY